MIYCLRKGSSTTGKLILVFFFASLLCWGPLASHVRILHRIRWFWLNLSATSLLKSTTFRSFSELVLKSTSGQGSNRKPHWRFCSFYQKLLYRHVVSFWPFEDGHQECPKELFSRLSGKRADGLRLGTSYGWRFKDLRSWSVFFCKSIAPKLSSSAKPFKSYLNPYMSQAKKHSNQEANFPCSKRDFP